MITVQIGRIVRNKGARGRLKISILDDVDILIKKSGVELSSLPLAVERADGRVIPIRLIQLKRHEHVSGNVDYFGQISGIQNLVQALEFIGDKLLFLYEEEEEEIIEITQPWRRPKPKKTSFSRAAALDAFYKKYYLYRK